MLLVAALLCLLAASDADEEISLGDDLVEAAVAAMPTCEPERCWTTINSGLDCLFNPRSTQSQQCKKLDAKEMCKVFEDALRCMSDEIERGCTLNYTTDSFDFWIRGLEAMNTKLCFDNLLQNMIDYAQCWDILRFSKCVPHYDQRLQHILHLAYHLEAQPSQADAAPPGAARERCNQAMLRISKCAGLAAREDPSLECARSPIVDTINEMLAAFFAASECGGGVGGSRGCPVSPPPPAPCTPPTTTPTPPTPTPEVLVACASSTAAFLPSLFLASALVAFAIMLAIKFA